MNHIQTFGPGQMPMVSHGGFSPGSVLSGGLNQGLGWPGGGFGSIGGTGGAPGGGMPFGLGNNFGGAFGGGNMMGMLQQEMAQLMNMMMRMLGGGAGHQGGSGPFAGCRPHGGGPQGNAAPQGNYVGNPGGYGGPGGGNNFNAGPPLQHSMQDPQTAASVNAAQQAGDGKVQFTAGMNIDSDGSGPSHGDPCYQNQTSMRLSNGQSLNADNTPYIVLPPQLAKKYHIKPGDLALVKNGDKVSPAIFGDVGPRNKLGEGSVRLAQNLGINASPTKGGTSGGVQYTVFPGSGKGQHYTNENTTTDALWQRINQMGQGQGPQTPQY